ncbi:HD domain-containing protein [Maricaulis maris]|jgi:5'-deoxynucleotidase YfbR-like HD superfamily hydrolase|uniref:Metal dependent phosphohydrolase n=1 Tax=Maricaulis maris (strain MCS10) TaxID=394221 RepID=Q0ARJ8_MARMM|nr:HD family hydrolase [Maricaulis maris]ABI65089.1 metal dependent phosphohydrolase [Maricaulis maris MCS10]
MPAAAQKTKTKEAPRAWQRMISGRRLDLLDPSPFDVEIEDIAHGLARVARWNGQTSGDHAFSVAEHSVVVLEILDFLYPGIEDKWRVAALLHDASEYVIGDMISPFKAALGVNYRAFEDRLEAAIQLRFGLPPKLPVEVKRKIKRADVICAYFEATQIAGFSHDESVKFFGRPPAGLEIAIKPLPVKQAQILFLDRFEAVLASFEAGRK